MKKKKQEVVISDKAFALLGQMRKQGGLPALNENIQDIFRLSNDTQTSAADLAGVIMRDCGLASNLLMAANSLTFAPRTPLKTITAAVTFLGFDQVYLMALAFSVFKQNMRENFDQDMLRLYASSYFSGIISMELSRFYGYTAPEEVFVAGLFYNLPCLALAGTFPEEYERLDQLVKSGHSMEDACMQVFEVSYEEICVGVVELYRIPGKVEDVLVRKEKRDDILHLIEAASHVTGMLFGKNPGGRQELDKIDRKLGKLLKKHSFSITDIIRQSCGQDKNMVRFFNLNPDDIDMMVNVLEWGKAIPAQVVNKLGIGEGLDDTLTPRESRETIFNSYMQELFLLRRSRPDLNQVLMLAQEAIYNSLGAPEVFTTFIDQDTNVLKGRFSVSSKSAIEAKDLTIPLVRNSSPVIRCFVEKIPFRWSEGSNIELGLPENLSGRLRLKHALFAPLVVNDRAIGLYFIGRAEDEPFTTLDEIWLAQIIENVEIVCERIRRNRPE